MGCLVAQLAQTWPQTFNINEKWHRFLVAAPPTPATTHERRRTTTTRCCVPKRAQQSRRRRSMGYGRAGRPLRQRGRRLPPPMRARLTPPHGRHHKAPPQPCALTAKRGPKIIKRDSTEVDKEPGWEVSLTQTHKGGFADLAVALARHHNTGFDMVELTARAWSWPPERRVGRQSV